MILEELLGLKYLFEPQTFYIYEAMKVVLVFKDKYFIFAAF